MLRVSVEHIWCVPECAGVWGYSLGLGVSHSQAELYRGQEGDVVLGFLGPQAHLAIGKGVRVAWLDSARLLSLAQVKTFSYGEAVPRLFALGDPHAPAQGGSMVH